MKICKSKGCNWPVFGGGYCKLHQYLRLDKPSKVLKKSILKRMRKPTGEKKVFDEIIDERPYRSQLSGKKIHNPSHVNCAHLLSKKKYPEYRLVKENIWLLTFEEHNLLDQGTEEQREKYAEEHNCDWSIIEVQKQRLLTQYKTLQQ